MICNLQKNNVPRCKNNFGLLADDNIVFDHRPMRFFDGLSNTNALDIPADRTADKKTLKTFVLLY